MRKSIIAVLFVMFAATAHGNQWTGNVNFFLGAKSLDSTDWDPVDDHASFGVLVDFGKRDWPVNIAIDLLGSYGEETLGGTKFEDRTSEFNVGVRKIWQVSGTSMRPYLGGGIAFVYSERERFTLVRVVDDDNGTGIWLNGGIYWTLGQSFNIGFDIRVTQADVTVFGIERDAGGTYGGLLLGYHW